MKTFKQALVFCLLLFCPAALYPAWVDADGTGREGEKMYDSASEAHVPDIAVDSRGHAHVVWFDFSEGSSEIYYLKWNGSEWVDADGAGQESINISQTSGIDSAGPKIALDSNDRPHVVWEDGPWSNRDIYYLYWDGGAWVDADGTGTGQINVSNTPDRSFHPWIRIDPSDRPHIMWSDGEGDHITTPPADIYYLKWDGSAWVDADGTGTGDARVYTSPYPSAWGSFELDASGNARMVWADGPETNYEIYYLEWNGSAWVDADGAGQDGINISNSPDYSSWPYITLDAAGYAHVVWEDYSSGYQNVYYKKWDGSAWVNVAAGATSVNVSDTSGNSAVPSIRLTSTGVPVITWTEGTLETCETMCVKRSGPAWTDMTGSGTAFKQVSGNNDNSGWAYCRLDANDSPHITWANGNFYEPHDIHYVRWMPEGTPTVTMTISPTSTLVPGASLTPTPTISPTWTITRTLTQTRTCTPTITPKSTVLFSATPDPCWADADGSGQDGKFVEAGRNVVLKLDSSGNPHLAWDRDNRIFYMRWNGSEWVDADGFGTESIMISGVFANCRQPDMELHSFIPGFEYPVIAWAGGPWWPGYGMIYVLRWNGLEWVDMDGAFQESASIALPAGGYPQDPSLDLDVLGRPGIAWSDYRAGLTYTVKDIYYLYWDGWGNWRDADGSGVESAVITTNTAECLQPDLELVAGQGPYIAWKWVNGAPMNNEAVVMMKFNGAVWTDADGTGQESICVSRSIAHADSPDLFYDASTGAHITWQDRYWGTRLINYVRYNGTSWVDVYNNPAQTAVTIAGGLTDYWNPSVAVDGAGRPHVAWFGNDGIYYLWWNGTAWVDADGTGQERAKLSQASASPDHAVSLRLDPAGKANVAWYDDISGEHNNYFLKYICELPSPTPTITPSPSSTASPTETAFMSSTITPTISLTPTATTTASITRTVTPTPETPCELSIIKKVSGENPKPGARITYEIIINNDTAQTAYHPYIWDTLPPEVELSAGASIVTGRLIAWDFTGTTLAPGAEIRISFSVTITNLRDEGLIINRASADYYDDYWASERHPAIESESAIFPSGRVAVYPNPVSIAKGTRLKFLNLAPGSTVTIYSISGEFIASIESGGILAQWNLRNRYGYQVSPGIYYYTIVNPEETATVQKGKIFIIN